jgi:DNA-binding response OmpR family regulator
VSPDPGLAVLLAEHEPEVAELGRRYLARAGARVTITTGADETTAALTARTAAVAVLDLTMPGLDARRLRRLLAPPPTPAGRLPALFLLSAAMRPRDLRVAAESCLWRPFSPRLLVSRVLAIAPRPAPAPPRSAPTSPASPATPDQPVLRTAGGLILDPATRRARIASSDVSTPESRDILLTPAEFALLTALAGHPGHVLTRDRLQALLTRLTRPTSSRPTSGRAIDVHVSQLRAKLPNPALIRTVRGVGYILDEPDPTAADTRDG